MLDEWQTEAIDLAIEALKKSTIDRDVAEAVKKEFDRRVRPFLGKRCANSLSIRRSGIASLVRCSARSPCAALIHRLPLMYCSFR